MKNLLFSVLLLFTLNTHAYTLDVLVDAIPNAQLHRVINCYVEDESLVCIEIIEKGTHYRIAVDPEGEVKYIFTPPSEKHPDGKVPLDYLLKVNSI